MENSLSYRIINPNPNPNPTLDQNLDPDSTHSKTPSPQHQMQLEANIERITTSSSPVRYRECLKNHAANIGGNVTDGCGEFMPNGEDGTPQALKCAACDCHRNFHRKDYSTITAAAAAAANTTTTSSAAAFYPTHSRHSLFTMPSSQSQQQHHHHHKLPHNYFYANTNSTPTAPIMMSFGVYGGGGAAAGESSSEDLNMFNNNIEGQGGVGQSKKRFRTKFTQEQKERMNVFADKVGWKIQKQDEQELQQFCDELGIKRQVFKVWMHNNKQAMKKEI